MKLTSRSHSGLVPLVTICAALAAAGAALPAVALATPAGHPASRPGTASRASLTSTASLASAASTASLASAASTASSGMVGGTVLGSDGSPLGGVCVAAAGRPGVAAVGRPGVAAAGRPGVVAARTGADGRYMITGLRPGRYTVSFQGCAGAGRYWPEPVRADVLAGQPTWLRPVTLRTVGPQAAAHPAGPQSAARPSAASATISGTVRGPSGKALAGICVGAASASNGSAPPELGEGTVTHGDGTYRLSVSAGRWTIGFTTGCLNDGNFAPQWWRHSATSKGATPLSLRKGEHLTGIDASLGVGAVITGTVRSGSASGAGLAGVCVIASGTGPMSAVFQQVATGSGGVYRMTGLGTGKYLVQFNVGCGAKGNYLEAAHRGLVQVTDGKTVSNVNGFLPLAARISGTVTTGGATPVPGICVEAVSSSSSGGGAGFAVTGVHGGYSIGGIPGGEYAVAFSGGCGNKESYAPQYYNDQVVASAIELVPAVAGQTTSGIGANMQPGGTITGTVTSYGGARLSGICVDPISAQQVGGLGPAFGLLLEAPFAGVGSTREGSYRLTNLAPGSYLVSFSSGCAVPEVTVGVAGSAQASAGGHVYAPQWFSPQGGNDPTWLSVGGGTVTSGVGARLRTAGSITGVVRTATGQGVRGICPYAFSRTGPLPLPITELLSITPPRTDAAGLYRITGLAAGRYTVLFEPCDTQPYALSWYADAGSSASARAVVVKYGATTAGIDQVVTGGGAVAGTVTVAGSGKPAADVCVEAVDSGDAFAGLTTTTGNGGYRFGHLAAGTYRLLYVPCVSSSSQLGGLTKPGVRVVAGRQAVVKVALPAAGSVAGTVLAGNPAAAQPGVCVEATPKTGNGVAGIAITGADGSYVLSGLAPGSYQIEFTPDCVLGAGALVPQVLPAPVAVTAGMMTSGVGATLAADGGISGTVQVKGAPAAGVCVVAYPSAGRQLPSAAVTGANGSYQMTGLLPGSYRVEFTAGCGAASYVTQWYDGASSRPGSTPVTVSAGTVTTAIDAH